MQVDSKKTYIGIVEDNNDPKKLGRCKIRVLDIFEDEIPTEDLPWAVSWKDLNGNEFNVPEIGKVVTIVFESGNIYKPEFISSEHYNENLQKKLEELGNDYTSMKALIFDHKTQIYVNDKDKLVIDYKMHQINIKDTGIDVNLKDNNGVLNLGSGSANQQAILGTNFLNWFDEFIDNLLGSSGGPYLGNLGSPVVPNPALIDVLLKYKSLKNPKFLSKNVNLNDNGYIDSEIIPTQSERITIGQTGDSWSSTVKDNELIGNQKIDFKPKYSGPLDGNLTTASGDESGSEQDNTEPSADSIPPASSEVNGDAFALLEVLRHKNYVIYQKDFQMNIIGVRYQYPGQPYSNQFIDRLYVVYKNESGAIKANWWPVSTMPGKYGGSDSKVNGVYKILHKDTQKIRDRGGLGILKPAQYVDSWIITEFHGEKALRPGVQKFYRDKNNGKDVITFSEEGSSKAGMLIHKGFNRAQGKNTYGVYNWSEGCTVIQDPSHLDQFFGLLEKHKLKYGNKFTYTLITSKDVEDAEKRLKR